MSAVIATTSEGKLKWVGPALSIFDPVYVGIDEFGFPVDVQMIYRNMLIGGVMDSGKSSLLNLIVAHAAMSRDCRLCLIDAKKVELGQWKRCADVFVGADLDLALRTLRRLQTMMDRRCDYLEECGRRKVAPVDVFVPYVIAIDEIAYFSATVGLKKDRDLFSEILRDLVSRGRAVGIIVVAATQRPSSDIIPPSLRDLFAWRAAFRCTNDVSSDIVLGHGWKDKGWSANTISMTNPGAGLLISESGTPQFIKAAYLSDADCKRIAAYAATLRAAAGVTKPAPLRVVA